MSDVKAIWDEGAHLYDEIQAGQVPLHRSYPVVVDVLAAAGARRVLDLGAGTGILAGQVLEALPDCSVTCLDISERMLGQARARLAGQEGRVEYVAADMMQWEPPEPYDAIVSANAMVYECSRPGECYPRCAAALAPGGVLLNSTYVEQATPACVGGIVGKLWRADGRPLSSAAQEFAQGSARRLARFAPDGLVVAHSLEEHLAMLAAAGLEGACVWSYLWHAVLLGVKA